MAELLPPDPYASLGVSRDATATAIKSAYRKAALRCHPDKAKGREDEFHRIQSAFEILGDDTKRKQYDDTVYMESLRRENQQRRSGRPAADARAASFDSRDTTFTAAFATRSSRVYEERRPKPQPDDEYRYFEPDDSRTWSRKHSGYEASPRKTAARPNKATEDVRKDAKEPKSPTAKERADRKKQRDKDTGRERERKYAYAEELPQSDSDEGFSERDRRRAYPRETYSRELPRRPTERRSDEDHFDKYTFKTFAARDHINQTKAEAFGGDDGARPPQFSRSASYNPEVEVRRGGKDTRPVFVKRSSTRSTREKVPEPTRSRAAPRDRRDSREPETVEVLPKEDRKPRPPPIDVRFSPPNPSTTRDTRRSKTEAEQDVKDSTRTFRRADSMPTGRSSNTRGDATPVTPSNLRHAETHDSGYSSPSDTTPVPNLPQAHTFTSAEGAKDFTGFFDSEHYPATQIREPASARRQRSPEEMARSRAATPRRAPPTPSRGPSYVNTDFSQPTTTRPRRPSNPREDSGPRTPGLPRAETMPSLKTDRGTPPREPLLFREINIPRSSSPTEIKPSSSYGFPEPLRRSSATADNYVRREGRDPMRRGSTDQRGPAYVDDLVREAAYRPRRSGTAHG